MGFGGGSGVGDGDGDGGGEGGGLLCAKVYCVVYDCHTLVFTSDSLSCGKKTYPRFKSSACVVVSERIGGDSYHAWPPHLYIPCAESMKPDFACTMGIKYS